MGSKHMMALMTLELSSFRLSAMLGKISRLFGAQLDGDTESSSSKRQDGDGWTASSSKKVRVEAVEMVCKPSGDDTDQKDDQEVVVIKEELAEDADNNSVKFETSEERKTESGHDLKQTIFDKETLLTSAHADLNLLLSICSHPLLCLQAAPQVTPHLLLQQPPQDLQDLLLQDV